MGIYLGPQSCYAKREGIYVKPARHKGVDTYNEALGIIYLIWRDLRRGWTYDQSCKKIRMTWSLAERRLLFLLRLAQYHRMPLKYRRKLEHIVRFIIDRERFPQDVLARGRRYIIRR